MHREQTSGLHNIWLKNGYRHHMGAGVQYEDPAGLVRAIAIELCQSPHRLGPDGTHFLRRLLELTQVELDAALEVAPETVAACEAGTDALPESRSRKLRLLAMEALNPATISPDVPEQSLPPAQRLVFEYADGRWHCRERITVPALLTDTPPADLPLTRPTQPQPFRR